MRRIFSLILLLPFLVCSQESDTTKKRNSFVVFPAISYAPETDLQLGAVGIWVLNNEDNFQSGFQRQSTLTPYFVYTLKKQSIAVANLDYYFPNGQNLNTAVRYYNFPDSYFGIGNDNDPDVSEKYTNRFFQVDGQYLIPVNEKVFIGGAYDAHFTNIVNVQEAGLLDSQRPIGIDGGNLFGVGPAFRYDTRDYTVYPSSGYFISSRIVFNALGDFDYTTYVADARKFINLKDKKHILAFQFRAQFTSGADVPFYKLPQLGGDERLRGIANASLYRDRQMMYTQVEYRRPLFWRFGMTVFSGVGDVAYSPNDFDLTEFKYIVGVGGRLSLIPDKQLNARLDIGVGRGGQTGIYIGVSEAF
ncbi:BamA/TamA family outer membrane protein [Ekhidna sp.]|uniref:BamA/TamA family outer membrane protein n=1 Tax=Ekhidna sp. TaxID=2608089 RepID=UPI003C7E8A0E